MTNIKVSEEYINQLDTARHSIGQKSKRALANYLLGALTQKDSDVLVRHISHLPKYKKLKHSSNIISGGIFEFICLNYLTLLQSLYSRPLGFPT